MLPKIHKHLWFADFAQITLRIHSASSQNGRQNFGFQLLRPQITINNPRSLCNSAARKPCGGAAGDWWVTSMDHPKGWERPPAVTVKMEHATNSWPVEGPGLPVDLGYLWPSQKGYKFFTGFHGFSRGCFSPSWVP